jgi:hypothetical protein
MLELRVAAFASDLMPAGLFQKADNVDTMHVYKYTSA